MAIYRAGLSGKLMYATGSMWWPTELRFLLLFCVYFRDSFTKWGRKFGRPKKQGKKQKHMPAIYPALYFCLHLPFIPRFLCVCVQVFVRFLLCCLPFISFFDCLIFFKSVIFLLFPTRNRRCWFFLFFILSQQQQPTISIWCARKLFNVFYCQIIAFVRSFLFLAFGMKSKSRNRSSR